MKTIFVTVFHSFISKNILNTDVFKNILQTEDLRIVLLVPFNKKDFFENIYSEKNIIIEGIDREIVFDKRERFFDRVAKLLIQGDLFDVVLLHLVRDGRGVVYSHIKLGRKPLSYMKQWAVVNLRTKIVKIRNKDIKNIFILYEDFVKNPVGVTSYILEQIGLEFESNMLNFNSYEHHQVGGNARLKNKKDTSEIKFDIKWKKQMALRYKIIFDLLFGWLNVFYKIKPKKYEKN